MQAIFFILAVVNDCSKTWNMYKKSIIFLILYFCAQRIRPTIALCNKIQLQRMPHPLKTIAILVDPQKNKRPNGAYLRLLLRRSIACMHRPVTSQQQKEKSGEVDSTQAGGRPWKGAESVILLSFFSLHPFSYSSWALWQKERERERNRSDWSRRVSGELSSSAFFLEESRFGRWLGITQKLVMENQLKVCRHPYVWGFFSTFFRQS